MPAPRLARCPPVLPAPDSSPADDSRAPASEGKDALGSMQVDDQHSVTRPFPQLFRPLEGHIFVRLDSSRSLGLSSATLMSGGMGMASDRPGRIVSSGSLTRSRARSTDRLGETCIRSRKSSGSGASVSSRRAVVPLAAETPPTSITVRSALIGTSEKRRRRFPSRVDREPSSLPPPSGVVRIGR
jgi:hypothetical protein